MDHAYEAWEDDRVTKGQVMGSDREAGAATESRAWTESRAQQY